MAASGSEYNSEDILSQDDAAKLAQFMNLHDKQFTKEDLFYLLTQAVDLRAYQCVEVLLEFQKKLPINKTELSRLAQKTADRGDGLLVYMLEQHDSSATSRRLFKYKIFFDSERKNLVSDEQFKNYLLTLLRFTPIEIIDKAVEIFSTENPWKRTFLAKIYEESKTDFYSTAPYFSRYLRTSDLKDLQVSYYRPKYIDLKTTAFKDLKYGEERKAFAQTLFAKLSAQEKYRPTQDEFLELPHSSTNTRRVAALLQEISAWIYEKQKLSEFKTLRSKRSETLIAGRYTWAQPLIESIQLFSQSKDIIKRDGIGYELHYNIDHDDLKLNSVMYDKAIVEDLHKWEHGRASLSDTWKRIEDLFETIWSMDLKKPAKEAGLSEITQYQAKLTEFYSNAAELVWLIGNTQPMDRGSGTFVELMFAIIHLHHDLQPPILKLDFPQLDLLNITFPLSDYKYFFPYFFEPSTIPEHLRFKDISPLVPLSTQMEQLYHKLKSKNEKSTFLQATTLSDTSTSSRYRCP